MRRGESEGDGRERGDGKGESKGEREKESEKAMGGDEWEGEREEGQTTRKIQSYDEEEWAAEKT